MNSGVNLYSYVGNNPLYWIDPLGLDWFRPEGADPTVGRDGIPGFEPGSGITGFLDNYMPAMHDMGTFHDYTVDELRKKGYPDWMVNFPTMTFAYTVAFFANVFGDGFSSTYDNTKDNTKDNTGFDFPDSGSMDPVDPNIYREFCRQNPGAPNCSGSCR